MKKWTTSAQNGIHTHLGTLQHTVDDRDFVLDVDQLLDVFAELRRRLLDILNQSELCYQAVQLLRKLLLRFSAGR